MSLDNSTKFYFLGLTMETLVGGSVLLSQQKFTSFQTYTKSRRTPFKIDFHILKSTKFHLKATTCRRLKIFFKLT